MCFRSFLASFLRIGDFFIDAYLSLNFLLDDSLLVLTHSFFLAYRELEEVFELLLLFDLKGVNGVVNFFWEVFQKLVLFAGRRDNLLFLGWGLLDGLYFFLRRF